MKHCLFFGFFAVTAAVFLGCVTPEPTVMLEIREREVIREVALPPDTLMPLTPSILQRLQETTELPGNISRFQLRLFGRITLEREFVESNDGLAEGGVARFENLHIRENITINDQTDGVAMNIEILGDEIILFVCFGDDPDNRLMFSAPINELNAFFHLVFTPNTGLTGDEIGTLQYGGEIYTVRFAGDIPPYLLILLSQRDTDRLNARTAPGRRVN